MSCHSSEIIIILLHLMMNLPTGSMKGMIWDNFLTRFNGSLKANHNKLGKVNYSHLKCILDFLYQTPCTFLNMVKLFMPTGKQIQGLLNSQPSQSHCCVIWSGFIENIFHFVYFILANIMHFLENLCPIWKYVKSTLQNQNMCVLNMFNLWDGRWTPFIECLPLNFAQFAF